MSKRHCEVCHSSVWVRLDGECNLCLWRCAAPRCGSCPYYGGDGVCQRHPPVLVESGWKTSVPVRSCTPKRAEVLYESKWPGTDGFETCGEHPDYPEWLKTKPKPIGDDE